MKSFGKESIYKYKRATIEDIDELVRTRIIVLRAANKLSEDVDIVCGGNGILCIL
jgi:hypothetical protein